MALEESSDVKNAFPIKATGQLLGVLSVQGHLVLQQIKAAIPA